MHSRFHTLAALCVAFFISRQAAGSLSYGFHLGSNLSDASVRSTGGTAASARFGFAGGFNIEAFLAGPLHLVMECNYAQRGFNAANGQSVLGSSSGFSLDYIEFPFLLKGRGLYYQPRRLSFLAGPVYAFQVRSNLPNSQKHVFNFLLGVGFEADIEKTTSFYINARYYFGISNVVIGTSDSVKVKGFQLLVGLQFETLGSIFFPPVGERVERFKNYRTKGASYQ